MKRLATTLFAAVAAVAVMGAGHSSVLNVGNGGEPSSLDPHLISGTWESSIARDQFLGLYTEAADGAVIPGAATGHTVSDDGLTYTFTIRDHSWSDGTPVTAGDFEFAFKRILAKETAAKYAFLLFPIDGAKGYNAGDNGADVVGVKAVDDSTLEVTLSSPTPYFISLLTHNTAYPVPKHVVEAVGSDWSRPENIVVNGAFKVVDWKVGDSITAEKNASFYDAANVALDQVVYYPIEETTAEYNLFREGSLHITNEIPNDLFDDLKDEDPDTVRVAPYGGTYYYSFNTTEAPFDNADVRNALSMTIDREFITTVVDTSGKEPAYSWVPTSLAGYEVATTPWADNSKAERKAMATELLEGAGFNAESPLSITLRYNTSEGHKAIALAISDMWKDLGVEVELYNTDVSTHYSDIQEQDFQIARAGWIWDYPDAENLLVLAQTGNTYNYGKYSDAEFDALLEASYKESDPAKRAAIMQQAEAKMLADAALAPIYYYNSRHLVSTDVMGWEENGDDRHPSRWISLK